MKKEIAILIIGAVIGALAIPIEALIVYYWAPFPYMPGNPNPFDGEIDIDLNQNLSYDGGIPETDLISLMLKLAGQDLDMKVIYDINLSSSSGKYFNQKIQRDNELHKITTEFPLKQDETYDWSVTAINGINPNKKVIGPVWKFETKKSQKLNLQNWHPQPYEGCSINVTPIKDTSTSINISYNLPKKHAWVLIKGNDPMEIQKLRDAKGLTFSYNGGGENMTSELKFVYEDGRTYLYEFPSNTSSVWKNDTKLYYKHMGCAPYSNCGNDKLDISKVREIHFAVSNHKKTDSIGKGWLVLDNVRGLLV